MGECRKRGWKIIWIDMSYWFVGDCLKRRGQRENGKRRKNVGNRINWLKKGISISESLQGSETNFLPRILENGLIYIKKTYFQRREMHIERKKDETIDT